MQGPSVDVAAIVREHGGYAWRVLRRLGVAERDVPDMAQEVFLVVHRKLAEFEGRSNVRTWLYGICVRMASDYRRRAVHRYEVPSEAPGEVLGADAAAQHEARDLLDRLLSSLDDDKRAVFVLYEIEQLLMKEIAEILECPLQTAYSRLHAARAEMAQLVRTAREP